MDANTLIASANAVVEAESSRIRLELEHLEATGGLTRSARDRLLGDIRRLEPLLHALRDAVHALRDPPATPVDLDPLAAPRLH
jgi:hypothetical protein